MKRKGVPSLLFSSSIFIVGIVLIIAPIVMRAQSHVPSMGFFPTRQQTDIGSLFWQTAGPQLGWFLLLTGIFASMWYLSRFAVLRRMDNHEDVYARWSFGQAESEKFRRQALNAARNNPMAKSPLVWVLFAGLTLMIGINVFLLNPHNPVLFFVITAGFGAAIASSIWLIRAIRRRAIQQDSGDVIIARGGVWYMGQLTDWNGKTSWLEKAEVMQNDAGYVLIIQHSILIKYGRSQGILEIPIPEGNEKEAREAAKQLMLRPY